MYITYIHILIAFSLKISPFSTYVPTELWVMILNNVNSKIVYEKSLHVLKFVFSLIISLSSKFLTSFLLYFGLLYFWPTFSFLSWTHEANHGIWAKGNRLLPVFHWLKPHFPVELSWSILLVTHMHLLPAYLPKHLNPPYLTYKPAFGLFFLLPPFSYMSDHQEGHRFKPIFFKNK